MTATKMQELARRMVNQSWCRYWLNYYDRHDHVLMAIQCRDADGKPFPIPDIQQAAIGEKFVMWHPDFFYTIERTNEDGTPYVSKLF